MSGVNDNDAPLRLPEALIGQLPPLTREAAELILEGMVEVILEESGGQPTGHLHGFLWQVNRARAIIAGRPVPPP
jgi:hypothetical protein